MGFYWQKEAQFLFKKLMKTITNLIITFLRIILLLIMLILEVLLDLICQPINFIFQNYCIMIFK